MLTHLAVLLFAVSTAVDRTPESSAAGEHVEVYLSEMKELLEDDVSAPSGSDKDLACWSELGSDGGW